MMIVKVQAQNTIASNPHKGHCGTSGKSIWERELAYRSFLQTGIMLDEDGNTQAFIAQPDFEANFPNLIVTCGRFKVYYEDVVVAASGGAAGGFADPTLTSSGLTLGEVRRNTLCDVLTYIESVLDFSAMPMGEYVHLYIDQSYSNVPGGVPSPLSVSFLAQASPSLTGANPSSVGFVSGDAHDHILGNDPDPNNYDANVQVNFDIAYIPQPGGGGGLWALSIVYLESPSQPLNTLATCDFFDLYSVLLHEMGHTLGWMSFIEENSTSMLAEPSAISPNLFSDLDDNLYYGDVTNPPLTTKLITGVTPSINTTFNVLYQPGSIPPLRTWAIWLNNQGIPHSHPVFSEPTDFPGSLIGHLAYTTWSPMKMSQFSPGFQDKYVMGPFFNWNDQRREFTNFELRGFDQSMGYSINPTFSNISTLLNNTPPHRTNNALPLQFTSGASINVIEAFEETYPANYTIINDNTTVNPTATTLTIDLSQLATLNDLHITDNDGDPISIAANSLYGIRGVSRLNAQGVNNHDCLDIPNPQTIIYTPEPEYVGKANFAFRLWDGKEMGSMVIVTIEVKQNGTIYPLGHELIVNGNFEDGTEVRTLQEPNKSYSVFESDQAYIGYTFSPYKMPMTGGRRMLTSQNAAIADGRGDCTLGQMWMTMPFYNLANNPISQLFAAPVFPAPTSPNNYRYGEMGGYSPYIHFPIIKNPITTCKRYEFSCDIAFDNSIAIGTPFELRLEGTANPVGTYPNPYAVYQSIPVNGSVAVTNDPNINGQANWQQVNKTFTYCAASTDYFQIVTPYVGGSAFVKWIDNMLLKEVSTPLVVQLQTISNDGCSYTLQALTNDGCPSYSYSWHQYPYFGGNTLTVPAGATYTVTITDGCGFSGTASITVPPYNTNTYLVPDNDSNPYDGQIHWNTQPNNLPNGGTLIIQGNLIMNYTAGTGFTLSNHEMIMLPYPIGNGTVEGQITVAQARFLNINQCHIHGCTQMWNGIVVENGLTNVSTSLVVTNNSLIEDARVGIDMGSWTTVSADNSIFNKNGIGIRANQLQVLPASIKARACTFDCNAPLLNDPVTNLTWSKEGINLAKMNYISSKPANLFQNMPCGIWAINSILTLAGERFVNINTDHGAFYNSPLLDGTAIICRSVNWGSSALRETGLGNAYNATPTFTNCRKAIYVGGNGVGSVSIAYNRIQNPVPTNTSPAKLRYGIDIRNTQAATITVKDNHISASEYAFSLQDYSIGTAHFQNNYVEMQNATAKNTLLSPAYSGVWVNDLKGGATANIHDNYIRTFAGITNAINLQNCGDATTTANDGAFVQNNWIEMKASNSGNAANRVGIAVTSGQRVKILNNNGTGVYPIPGNLASPTNQPPGISGTTWQTAGIASPPQNTPLNTMSRMPAAISVSGSPDALIQCNTMDNVPIGARFHNQSLGTDLSGNTFGRHSFGLYLSVSGVIGQQDSKGNQWTWAGTPTTGYEIGAWNRNGATPPPIRINNGFLPITINDFPKVPIKQAVLSMFPPYPIWFNSNTSTTEHQCTSIPSPLILSGTTSEDEQVAEGVDLSEEYAEEMLWTAQRDLYDKLVENPELLPEEGTVTDFYEEKSQMNFANFQSIQAAQRELMSSVNPAISANDVQIDNYLTEIALIDSLIGMVTDSLVLDSLNNIVITQKAAIASLIEQNENLRAAEISANEIERDAVLTDNALLTGNEVYEENEKLVNQIYIETVVQEVYELTTYQENALYSIANQCPLSGGRSVYIARSLWALFYENAIYDDDSLCEAASMQWRTIKTHLPENRDVSISPNPTNKELNFSFSKSFTENTNLAIYDSYGKMVGSVIIPAETTRYVLKVSGLPQGVYFYQIDDSKGKFVIIH